MTFSEDAITDCKITSSGNDDLMKDDLRSSMAAAVVDSQGDTSVDAITSSTLSFGQGCAGGCGRLHRTGKGLIFSLPKPHAPGRIRPEQGLL